MPLISALAGLIAKSIWPMLMPIESVDLAGAIVDRDGESGVRVDLRSVPAIRQAISRGSLGMVVDVLEAEAIVVEANQLSIKLRLPQLLR